MSMVMIFILQLLRVLDGISKLSSMEDMIAAIKKSLEDQNYYSALFLTLVLPSICGALESANGQDSGEKYKDWYDRYITDSNLDGEECFRLRCSLGKGPPQLRFHSIRTIGAWFPGQIVSLMDR